MKLVLAAAMTLSMASASLFSQDITRAQKVKLIADLSEKIQSLENELLEPSSEDKEFATSKGLTAIRLLPRGTFGENTFGRGGGAYYSFTTGSHSYNRTPEIELQRKRLSVGFAGADYGFIVDLGVRSITTLDTTSPELKFMSEYRAPKYEKDIRSEARSLHNRKIDGVQYGRDLEAVEGHSYLLRAITFDEADILVGFTVIRIEDDGSVILAYKKFEEFGKPTIFSASDSDLKVAAQKIITSLGVFNGITIDVKENILTLSGKLDPEEWNKFQNAYQSAGLRFRGIGFK